MFASIYICVLYVWRAHGTQRQCQIWSYRLLLSTMCVLRIESTPLEDQLVVFLLLSNLTSPRFSSKNPGTGVIGASETAQQLKWLMGKCADQRTHPSIPKTHLNIK